MDALAWWLIPIGVVLLALGVFSLVSYLRRPTEDHDLGQFASMREAMEDHDLGQFASMREAMSRTRNDPRVNRNR